MKKLLKVVSLLGLGILALPMAAWADNHEEAAAPPPLSDVWIMVPKRGMEAEFGEAMAKHMAFRKEMEDSRDWTFYNVAIGKNMSPVQARACCFNWADMDSYLNESVEKGFGEHFNSNVDQYVDHYHHYIDRTDWENSHWPDGEGNGPYYGVTTWHLKGDAGPGTSQAVDKMSQLAKDNGWANDDNNWLWMSQIGGGDVLALVSSYDNYADMEPPEQTFYAFAVEQLGEEEAGAMFSNFSSGFKSSDYTVWVLNEEFTPSDDE